MTEPRTTYVASLIVAHMEAGRLDTAPIWSDVRTFDGKPWRGKIDCITARYPEEKRPPRGGRKFSGLIYK